MARFGPRPGTRRRSNGHHRAGCCACCASSGSWSTLRRFLNSRGRLKTRYPTPSPCRASRACATRRCCNWPASSARSSRCSSSPRASSTTPSTARIRTYRTWPRPFISASPRAVAAPEQCAKGRIFIFLFFYFFIFYFYFIFSTVLEDGPCPPPRCQSELWASCSGARSIWSALLGRLWRPLARALRGHLQSPSLRWPIQILHGFSWTVRADRSSWTAHPDAPLDGPSQTGPLQGPSETAPLRILCKAPLQGPSGRSRGHGPSGEPRDGPSGQAPPGHPEGKHAGSARIVPRRLSPKCAPETPSSPARVGRSLFGPLAECRVASTLGHLHRRMRRGSLKAPPRRPLSVAISSPRGSLPSLDGPPRGPSLAATCEANLEGPCEPRAVPGKPRAVPEPRAVPCKPRAVPCEPRAVPCEPRSLRPERPPQRGAPNGPSGRSLWTAPLHGPSGRPSVPRSLCTSEADGLSVRPPPNGPLRRFSRRALLDGVAARLVGCAGPFAGAAPASHQSGGGGGVLPAALLDGPSAAALIPIRDSMD
ncbi:hypothetical protein M885DRAFT_92370 [Pelagophyceae sp. CCMP2097]|nr:hypothetical protein M885DRAFT_92370 [Pelagophyceae sp. CCMP2097]